MKLRVAITGGIACGKTLFSHALEALGWEVLDADAVVHQLEAPGGAAVAPLLACFGPMVQAADGGIDRKALGQLVFAERSAREKLNALIHPLVKQAIEKWLAGSINVRRAVVIPLLFEVGWQQEWDVIICLVSCEQTQCERLMRMRGLTREAAWQRITSQMPIEEKASRSQIVVRNEGDVSNLALQARCVSERFESNDGEEYEYRSTVS